MKNVFLTFSPRCCGADVLTIGRWEPVGVPVEVGFNGKKMTVPVTYGPDDHVKSAEALAVSDP